MLNLNLTKDKNMQRSHTDTGFIALCHHWRDEDRDEQLCLQWIAETYTDLVILSCQHTLESRTYWPTPEAWRKLKSRVALVVVRYFNHGPVARAKFLAQMCSNDENPNHAVASFSRLDEERSAEWESRREPADLKAIIETRRRKAAKDKEEGKKVTEREEASEEMCGALWRNSAVELVDNYVRLASRVVYTVDMHARLRNLYPSRVAPRFTEATYNRVYQWVIAKCRVEQTETTTKLVRDLSNMWWCPLGTETQRYRDKDTRSDVVAPLHQLESELGVTLAQHLHDQSLTKLTEVAKRHPGTDKESIFWTPLLFALFQTTVKQALNLDWLGVYFSVMPHLREPSKRMSDEYYKLADKRPLVRYLERKWITFHQQHHLVCDRGGVHALLSWLYLVSNAFDGEGDQCEDFKPIIDLFLDKDSIQL